VREQSPTVVTGAVIAAGDSSSGGSDKDFLVLPKTKKTAQDKNQSSGSV
jgi:hypothetical protein